MTRFSFTLVLSFSIFNLLSAQKEVYIPIEWQQPGNFDYTFDRSAASDNFIIFWGPLAGTDPTQAPTDIAFNPDFILDTAEELYHFYIDTLQFVEDQQGLLSHYKIILVMLHTWPNLEGWAFGGNYDGTVGAMWMHPHAAHSGPTLAHEFVHTLQNYTWMQNPGHGFIDSSYVGFFWEAHAEFMALQRFPSVALEFDMARWLNTCHFHWSSTRHHYQAFIFLQFVKEQHGITLINRMWNESLIGEHPLQTYMRLTGTTQDELNASFATYAMRNVTWDYEIGDLLRERNQTLNPVFVAHPTFIPEAIDTIQGWYRMQNHLAPQDYGYNIIRLHPETMEGCDERIVYINLQTHTLAPDPMEGHVLFGFVAVDGTGQPRYSEIYPHHTEVAFTMEQDETELYLVVTGAPVSHHNYAWEIGFPKIYRYPYDFHLENAWPEGHQPGFRQWSPDVPGAPHPHGGGFVASTAHVDPTAYVGPDAVVLEQARVEGFARIEDHAIVRHNARVLDSARIAGLAIIGESARIADQATVSGQARVYGSSQVYGESHVTDNALIFHTTVYDQARLNHNTFCWGAELYGDIVLGGDAEFFSVCSEGTYMQVEFAYNRNCDGQDVHPANVEVTTGFEYPDRSFMYVLTCDGLIENIHTELVVDICQGDTLFYQNDTLTLMGMYTYTFQDLTGADSIVRITLEVHEPAQGDVWLTLCQGDTIHYYDQVIHAPGVFQVYVDSLVCGIFVQVFVEETSIDTTISVEENTLTALAADVDYQWLDCATGWPVSGAEEASFTPGMSGHYQVQLTSAEGCTAISECYMVTAVAVEAPLPAWNWRIRTNPVSGFLLMDMEGSYPDEILVEVADAMGVGYVQDKFPVDPQSLLQIGVDHFPSGVYFVSVRGPAGPGETKAFVKVGR